MIRATIPQRIEENLSKLNVNDSLDKNALILELYLQNDYWITRSFDVNYYKAKKQLLKMKFKCSKSVITRIE